MVKVSHKCQLVETSCDNIKYCKRSTSLPYVIGMRVYQLTYWLHSLTFFITKRICFQSKNEIRVYIYEGLLGNVLQKFNISQFT